MSYQPLIKGGKLVMEVPKVKGLWLGVIKSVGETNLGLNRVEINLDLIKEKE